MLTVAFNLFNIGFLCFLLFLLHRQRAIRKLLEESVKQNKELTDASEKLIAEEYEGLRQLKHMYDMLLSVKNFQKAYPMDYETMLKHRGVILELLGKKEAEELIKSLTKKE